ncbi:hypothetical protein NC651_036373 [Populus alba x Populus x berolinensis]|nr:hypothetical protein NC651_036373 [Populus alba x Populus x berolinensis]
MARPAKEAATIRRVLEPLFQNFDGNNHWSQEKGVAYPVFTFLQSLLEETGCIWNLMHHLFRLCAHKTETSAGMFMDTPRPCSPLAWMEFQAFEEIMPAAALADDDTFTELNGSQSGRRTSMSVLSVKELLEPEWLWNVLKIANLGKFKKKRVGSKLPVPYDQMKSQCEALVTGKQQKMSILHSFKPQAEAKVFPIEEEKKDTSIHDVNTVASVLRFGGSDNKIETKLSLKIATPRRTVTGTPIFDVLVITIIVFTIVPEV